MINHDTPEAIAITDKAAQNLMLSELLKICTPAPWRTNIWGGVSDRNGNDIRATGLVLTNSEVAKNNSNLISLAPTISAELIKERELNATLLEALKGVVKVADRATMEFDAARAVIAKAEGVQL